MGRRAGLTQCHQSILWRDECDACAEEVMVGFNGVPLLEDDQRDGAMGWPARVRGRPYRGVVDVIGLLALCADSWATPEGPVDGDVGS